MRLLDRYLFRELLTPLAFCLGGFLLFWISADAFKSMADFQDGKLGLLDIAEYYLMKTPEFLVLILPMVLLLALLYTLTHHARYNEITAMRAAGISLWRLCVPYLAVGLAASLFLFALREWGVPRSSDRAEQILSRYVQKPESARKNEFRNFGFTNVRDHRAWFIAQYNARTGEMLKPLVTWTLPDGSTRRLYADRAIHTNGVWTFFNASEYSQADNAAPLVPALQTNMLARPEFTETPGEIRSEIKINGYEGHPGAHTADIPLMDIWSFLRLHPALPGTDSNWLFTKLHERLASPWTCLVVVLIAIPFGAASGRRNLFFGVAGSIFICFSYFVIQQVSLAVGTNGWLPPWLAAWLPNLLFGGLGLVLTARVR